MFQSARFKLTAWYLLIIMAVSLAFSGVIYRMFAFEFDRFARIQRYRIEHRLDVPLPLFSQVPSYSLPPSTITDESLIGEARRHLLLILGSVNIGVFVIAGALGYFLAGRTLKPIADMVDEQHRFISDASHELRTPLTSLKSSLEVNLRDSSLSPADAKHVMKESLTDVNKLQSLTDALLQLAQYQSPTTFTQFASIDVSRIITSAMRNVSGIAKKKHVSITHSPVHVSLEADEYSLTDVLTILLDNATKYSIHHSSIVIKTDHIDHEVIIKIIDHGQGIKAKDVPHIFDRFYRADVARGKQNIGGYGLGLSIAKQIVALHNGSINVDSAWQKGSTFTVRLPTKRTHMVLS